MSTKQKIILSCFLEGKTKRQMRWELHIVGKTAKKCIASYQASAEGVERGKQLTGKTKAKRRKEIGEMVEWFSG